jgi:hypothetical protein|tara:strand:- start:2575 stop:3066 length:492 start_codon:yes stop_codon:yes gene_type:complete
MENIKLNKLERGVRYLIAAFLIVLTIGVTVGIVYVYTTAGIKAQTMADHYYGSSAEDFDIPEKYPKTFEGMLLTTHTHVISFSIIFFLIGTIFHFNSIISGTWKYILTMEPFFATVITFSSLWGIRYIHQGFSYITIFSGVLMYLSFYFLVLVLLYDLILRKI